MAEVIYEVKDPDTKENEPKQRYSWCNRGENTPGICSVKFIQQKKKSIWAIPFFSLFYITGLITYVLACVFFKDYIILVSLVPLPIIGVVVLLFGCPTPFEWLENDYFYNFSTGLLGEDPDNVDIDCSCIDEGCVMYSSARWGHFLMSCIGICPFGIIITLFTSGAISLFGVIFGFFGILLCSVTSLVYLIRYHYNRHSEDDFSE